MRLEVIFLRGRVSRRRDKKIFSRTAAKSKSVNLGNVVMRGGIRF